ncbi:hypothetical protein [Streptomyces luteireticuli]
MLRDSARLQEEQADHANRRGHSKHRPAGPSSPTPCTALSPGADWW